MPILVEACSVATLVALVRLAQVRSRRSSSGWNLRLSDLGMEIPSSVLDFQDRSLPLLVIHHLLLLHAVKLQLS
jgi:hypothetical protein